MRIHKVKSPFMSRLGQFETSKQTLCIGLDFDALKVVDIFRVFIGNNEKKAYDIRCVKALAFAYSNNSFWNNKEGKKVAIIPLFKFDEIDLS